MSNFSISLGMYAFILEGVLGKKNVMEGESNGEKQDCGVREVHK